MGLCFDDFDLRFLLEGAARVGGGVPIFSRAAAFTAAAALKGLGLRGFDGIDPLFAAAIQQSQCECYQHSELGPSSPFGRSHKVMP